MTTSIQKVFLSVFLCSSVLLPLETSATVVLDPGHGGARGGVGGCEGLREKQLTLQMALQIQKKTAAHKVVLTRSDDNNLQWQQRAALANQQNVSLFLSLHAESSPMPETRGMRLYALLPNMQLSHMPLQADELVRSYALDPTKLLPTLDAIALQHIAESDRLSTELEIALRQSFAETDITVMRGRYVPLMGVQAPAVMIGLGFLSNAIDCENLKKSDYRARLVQAISQSITAFQKMSP